jgi:flagellar protein FlbT
VALTLKLKPGERAIIGSAVVRNSAGSATITVENETPVLREKRILSPNAVTTPVQRLAFTIQLMYLSGDKTEELEQAYLQLLTALVREAPSMTPLLTEISQAVLRRDYYRALKQACELIDYETELIENAQSH